MKYDRKKPRRRRTPQKGSALLVSLMVMVGLSLLGLGYVAVSETESAIAINERNSSQTREVAEAGVKVVVEWFQDPDWADAEDILPSNIVNVKTDRKNGAGVSIGYYKPSGLLFDKPHKGADQNRFFGDEDHADIIINNTTLSTASGADQTYLNTLNQTLLNGDYSAGRITEIKVYAPPFSGATNVGGFYDGGIRLGLATIAVTATKCRDDSDANPCLDSSADSRVISRRTVKAVISEWPFPGPSGPVQTNANLGTNGDVRVHWGKITATGSMKLKRPFGSLPWHDAWTKVNFQYGYSEPVTGSTWAASDNTWPTVPASADVREKHSWLYQLAGQTLEDPWYEAWSRGDFTGDGTGGTPVAYPYNDPTLQIYDTSGSNTTVRAVFQRQTKDEQWDYRSILFPKFNYDFWKDIAKTADDQDNVFYLSYVSGDDVFEDKDGNEDEFEDWVNVEGGAKAGFYFFDTANGQNPQLGGSGTLTPDFQVKGNPFQMQGFIYSNSEQWDSAGGADGPYGFYNMPGEPYKDIGFDKVVIATNTWELDGLGNHVLDTTKVGNGQWDYQELNGNDIFDYVVAARTFDRPDGTTGVVGYFPIPYYPTCTVGTNCSEPHEPYLNYRFTTDTVGGVTIADNDGAVTMGWDNANTGKGQALPKTTDTEKSSGNVVSCATLPATEITLRKQCTSNAYDEDGPLVRLHPGLNGVLYVEGQFEQTGNMPFFGSILAEGDFGKAGTPDVWFDERLIKNEWPPKEFRFPRVFISALQSD